MPKQISNAATNDAKPDVDSNHVPYEPRRANSDLDGSHGNHRENADLDHSQDLDHIPDDGQREDVDLDYVQEGHRANSDLDLDDVPNNQRRGADYKRDEFEPSK